MATDATVILGFVTNKVSSSLSGTLQLLGSIAGDDILGVNSTNLTCTDGTNSQTIAHGGFTATEQVVVLFQTDISENKMRLGTFIYGEITWNSWNTYDGSLDLEVQLDVLVNAESMDLLGISICSSILSDSEIQTELVTLYIPVLSGVTSSIKSNQATLTTTVSGINPSSTVTINFYDNSDDSLIDSDTITGDGSVSVNWVSLSPTTSYSWYPKLDNGTWVVSGQSFIFTTNTKPYVSGISPVNGDEFLFGVTSIDISAIFNDDEGGSGALRFYDASDNSLITVVSGVADGASGQIVWENTFEKNETYSFYIIPNDGVEDGAKSLTTDIVIINNYPNIPVLISPDNNTIFSTAGPQDLLVSVSDLDNDSLLVNFYDGSDDSLIATYSGIVGSGIAQVTWSDIAKVGDYQWYVTVYDGEDYTTTSGDNYVFTLASKQQPESSKHEYWWLSCSGVNWWGQDYTRNRDGGLVSTYTTTEAKQGRRKSFMDFYTTYSGLSY